MSIIRTKCPTLFDLAESTGLGEGIDSRMPAKPLCDNIFDVQRSQLVEVLERLRTAFWSDEAVVTSIPTLPETTIEPTPLSTYSQPQTPTDSYKRTYPESEDTVIQETKSISRKRVRLNAPQADERKKPLSTDTPPTPKSLQSFSSLWPLKKSIIRRIKTDNRYNEAQLLAVLTDIYQTKSLDQCRHLGYYFLPVAKAMRKENIVNALEQWL